MDDLDGSIRDPCRYTSSRAMINTYRDAAAGPDTAQPTHAVLQTPVCQHSSSRPEPKSERAAWGASRRESGRPLNVKQICVCGRSVAAPSND